MESGVSWRHVSGIDLIGSSKVWWLVWQNPGLNSSDWLMAAQGSGVFLIRCEWALLQCCCRVSHFFHPLSRMRVICRIFVSSRLLHVQKVKLGSPVWLTPILASRLLHHMWGSHSACNFYLKLNFWKSSLHNITLTSIIAQQFGLEKPLTSFHWDN